MDNTVLLKVSTLKRVLLYALLLLIILTFILFQGQNLNSPPIVNAGPNCPVGQGWNGASCENCSPGYYSDESAFTDCKSCPAGTFSGASGAQTCDLCSAGTYNPSTAASSCLSCPAQELQGATTCPAGGGGSGSADTSTPEDPPGLWLSALCEPNDGFSDPEYGNMITIGSDAASKTYGTTLYVGTSIEGPWTATTFGGPAYAISKTQIEALADSLGLSDYHDLWFKVSTDGTAANLGAMITDRAAGMDVLCNP